MTDALRVVTDQLVLERNGIEGRIRVYRSEKRFHDQTEAERYFWKVADRNGTMLGGGEEPTLEAAKESARDGVKTAFAASQRAAAHAHSYRIPEGDPTK